MFHSLSSCLVEFVLDICCTFPITQKEPKQVLLWIKIILLLKLTWKSNVETWWKQAMMQALIMPAFLFCFYHQHWPTANSLRSRHTSYITITGNIQLSYLWESETFMVRWRGRAMSWTRTHLRSLAGDLRSILRNTTGLNLEAVPFSGKGASDVQTVTKLNGSSSIDIGLVCDLHDETILLSTMAPRCRRSSISCLPRQTVSIATTIGWRPGPASPSGPGARPRSAHGQ